MKGRNFIHFIAKIIVCTLLTFFIFRGVSVASIASSDNYKLYTATADGGGTASSSTNYNSENSIGAPISTASTTGTNYKIYSGSLPTLNAIPDVTVASFNDGTLTMDETPTLSWSYEDKDGDPQRYYQVQVSKDNFQTFVVDTGLVESSSNKFTTPILPTEEGGITYRWRVRVSDGFDYSGWQVAASGFRLTTVAMEVPIIWARVSPSGAEIPSKLWQNCATPYFYWEYPVSGVDIVGYSYAWGSIPDNEVDTTAYSYQTPDGLLSDGIRVFNLKAQNTAGNWSDVATFEIWLDRAAPRIGAYTPTNGTLIATDTPTISINVTDEHSGVNPDSITMKVNRSTAQATYDEGGQRVVYIPSIPLSEGDNVISLEVSDLAGNRSTPLVWSFVVDTRAPRGGIVINNEDAVTNSVYVNLSLNASDTTSGVNSMCISNDGVFDTEPWESFKTRKDSWMLPAISGTRKVYVRFRDNAGNISEIFSDTIELVIIAPDTIITSGPSLLTNATHALFTFKATTTGCVFRWKFDDEEWSEWSTKTSVRREDLSEGNHYFKVQAAKDVNNNNVIDPDEIDPVPEQRTWTIGEEALKPELHKRRPFRFWKEE